MTSNSCTSLTFAKLSLIAPLASLLLSVPASASTSIPSASAMDQPALQEQPGGVVGDPTRRPASREAKGGQLGGSTGTGG